MTYEIPINEPTEIKAGFTLKFKVYEEDFLPADWTLKYYLLKEGAQIILTGTDNGDNYHLFDVAPATTATYIEGDYKFRLSAEDGIDKYEIRTGEIKVTPNYISNATGYDVRSPIKKTLDALTKACEGLASKEEMEYTINGKSLKRMSLSELIKCREKYLIWYKQEKDAERVKAGLPNRNKIYFRFK